MLTFNKNQETKVRIFHASWAAHWFDNRDSRQVQGSFISETEWPTFKSLPSNIIGKKFMIFWNKVSYMVKIFTWQEFLPCQKNVN